MVKRDSSRRGEKPRFKKDETRIVEKKYCRFCRESGVNFDYKDSKRLEKFLTERGKILSRRISGNCARHQRKLTVLIKRARFLALLPYTK